MKTTILSIFVILFSFVNSIEAKNFKIASYNVQNLFDIANNGTEYAGYIPNTDYGWNRDMLDIKARNIARVINDLKADIVALQEVESKKSLIYLRSRLMDLGVDYPYLAIADLKATTVKCAVISKFPVVKKEEIIVDNKFARNILKVTLDVEGNHLILYVNHWKSKQDPESSRIVYAKALKEELDKLEDNVDFILTGDFNSNYNEYKTFRNSAKLNDTGGISGINHILRTNMDSVLVDEKILLEQTDNEYLYNLWLEIDKKRCWSYNFFGDKNSPDSIIVSKGLYDEKGISYIDNSFDKFDPDYLFKGKAIYQWQRAKKGRGRHLGKGYSDHLPVFACFSTEPFFFKKDNHKIPGH
ncbi:MAG TPA: endonuclease/exonuclease/phosphatase family protein [Anaerolineae bacterium]|nr:endonuclease/exonuclease/phosphatase family protein [Anaerolineae bacterium]